MNTQHALVIEDDQALSRAYGRVLSELGFKVEISHNTADARLKIRSIAPALILVDIELPDGNGLDLMDELRNSTRERFIVISGNSSQRAAIKSIRHRAVKFVSKPVSLEALRRSIEEVVSQDTDGRRIKSDSTSHVQAPDFPDTDTCWINHGNSPALVELRTAISFSAELRKGHALIVGEPGLEKRSIAVELHKRSRRSGAIVFLDCAAQSDMMLQTALFGSANDENGGKDAVGCIDSAAGGTLVLENVDDLSDELQSALSLFLDTGVFKRPGSEQGYQAVVAVVGIVSDHANSASLKTDFAVRLSKFTLHVPSLRECTGDLGTIARWLLAQIDPKQADRPMSSSLLSRINDARWPDNIRELRQLIQAAVDHSAESTGSEIQLQLPVTPEQDRWEPLTDLVGLTLRDFSEQLIIATLAHHQGDKATTAKTLGISLKTLYNRLNSHKTLNDLVK